jgi:hypothetical protein
MIYIKGVPVEFETEELVLVSETTTFKNGFESRIPSMEWRPLPNHEFFQRVEAGFNPRGLKMILEDIENPPRDHLDGEGWYHITITQERHGIVGRWTGGLRIRRVH